MSMQWSWLRPQSLDETVGILLEKDSQAMLVAGGTALSLSPPRRANLTMVDLQALGLDHIEVIEGAVRIGAMVRAHQIASSCDVGCIGAGMLSETCTTMGPRPVRNRITVGGNVMQAFRWCDLPVSLLALGARFEMYGPESTTRTVGADDLFVAQPRKALRAGELLAATIVNKDQVGQAGAFVKLAMTMVDHSIVSAAAHVTVEGEKFSQARVAVGALTAIPQRLERVEEQLVGRGIDAATIKEASEASRDATVHGDRRASEDYRREMTAVVVRRAVETAAVRARISLQGGGSCS
jgi:CO/xanthine dehydrogenase FAD-binding subunit